VNWLTSLRVGASGGVWSGWLCNFRGPLIARCCLTSWWATSCLIRALLHVVSEAVTCIQMDTSSVSTRSRQMSRTVVPCVRYTSVPRVSCCCSSPLNTRTHPLPSPAAGDRPLVEPRRLERRLPKFPLPGSSVSLNTSTFTMATLSLM
jgi:hypothetical protein